MSFEGSHRDFDDWTPFVVTGGLVLMQGGISSPNKPMPEHCGMVRLVKEVVSQHHGFRIDRYVDTIAVVEKL
jgi:hypothetical protein